MRKNFSIPAEIPKKMTQKMNIQIIQQKQIVKKSSISRKTNF